MFQWGGVSKRNLRKEPKLGIDYNLWRGTRASAGNLWEVPKTRTVRLVRSSGLLGQGRRIRAESPCRSSESLGRFEWSEEAEPLAGRGWLGAEEGENLRKHPNIEELISEEFTTWEPPETSSGIFGSSRSHRSRLSSQQFGNSRHSSETSSGGGVLCGRAGGRGEGRSRGWAGGPGLIRQEAVARRGRPEVAEASGGSSRSGRSGRAARRGESCTGPTRPSQHVGLRRVRAAAQRE